MPYKNIEDAKAYRANYSKLNKDKIKAYTKKQNKARNNAYKILVELHREEFDVILAGEKMKMGISDRKLSDLSGIVKLPTKKGTK